MNLRSKHLKGRHKERRRGVWCFDKAVAFNQQVKGYLKWVRERKDKVKSLNNDLSDERCQPSK